MSACVQRSLSVGSVGTGVARHQKRSKDKLDSLLRPRNQYLGFTETSFRKGFKDTKIGSLAHLCGAPVRLRRPSQASVGEDSWDFWENARHNTMTFKDRRPSVDSDVSTADSADSDGSDHQSLLAAPDALQFEAKKFRSPSLCSTVDSDDACSCADSETSDSSASIPERQLSGSKDLSMQPSLKSMSDSLATLTRPQTRKVSFGKLDMEMPRDPSTLVKQLTALDPCVRRSTADAVSLLIAQDSPEGREASNRLLYADPCARFAVLESLTELAVHDNCALQAIKKWNSQETECSIRLQADRAIKQVSVRRRQVHTRKMRRSASQPRV